MFKQPHLGTSMLGQDSYPSLYGSIKGELEIEEGYSIASLFRNLEILFLAILVWFAGTRWCILNILIFDIICLIKFCPNKVFILIGLFYNLMIDNLLHPLMQYSKWINEMRTTSLPICMFESKTYLLLCPPPPPHNGSVQPTRCLKLLAKVLPMTTESILLCWNNQHIPVTTNERLTKLKEELRWTDQSFAQLAQVLHMTLIKIHTKLVTHTICVSL